MTDPAAILEAPAPPSARRLAWDKSRRWGTLLAKFVSVQIVVQAIGLVAGLLLIRISSQRDYTYSPLGEYDAH